ncbi:hypothetical protein [Fuerstiella marisgermanici]|uniref:Uncharacterized protein n=1 Tax=Fuerstiella marisgermanici TaxID=1891926 RepID=A0A1P8WP80_9PLAN|nr:hypothetical protein [Fuerstiella marisgermanici]APZ95856.1 hypothetical protein Fuma_05519 [Fuerstiella marisgermanici]
MSSNGPNSLGGSLGGDSPHQPPPIDALEQGPKKVTTKPMGPKELKGKLEDIRSRLSKLVTTLEPSPLGSTIRGINSERDTKLSKELRQVSARLQHAEKLGLLRHSFATSANHGVAKQKFNRSAKRSM